MLGALPVRPAWAGTPPRPSGSPHASSSLELLGGEVRNASDSCGRPRPITVQFLGPVSPRVEILPGAAQPVSLARGFYQAAVQTPDGVSLETPFVVVDRKDFVWSFGCLAIPEVPALSDPADPPATIGWPHPPALPGASAIAKVAGTVPVRFANTTGDCGDPRTVVFLVNGSPAATAPPDAVVVGRVPSGEFLLEVASLPDNRRLLVRHVAGVESGQTLHHGCTDPDFASRKDGVAVVFENATDSCPSPAPLTLWVDGWPRIGLLPGRATTLGLPRGPHEFEVRQGLLPARLLHGTRDVQAPFRIRYGCSKQD